MFDIIHNTDYIEYYSAAKIFFNNQNCYDPDLMKDAQVALGANVYRPTLMMWSPPFLLFVFYPLIFFDLNFSFVIWELINFFILFDIVRIATRNFLEKSFIRNLSICICLLVAFVPLRMCFQLGQIGIMLTWVWLKFLLSYENHQTFRAGFYLSLFFIKPHLFLLSLVYLFTLEFKNKRIKLFLASFVSFVALQLLTYLVNRDSLLSWFNSFFNRAANINFLRPEEWKTSNFIFWIFEVFDIPNKYGFYFSNFIFVVVILLLVLTQLRVKQEQSIISLDNSILISIIFSPFYWIFDCVLYIPMFIKVLDSKIPEGAFMKCEIRSFAFLTIVFALIWSQPFGHYFFYHQLGWFPLLTGMSLLVIDYYGKKDIA